ncbi:unnamed protein product [Effrenium voratum]|nr:unnamed protein product [Effrenium voratum]
MDFLIFTHASSLEALAEASDYAPGLQKLLSPGEGGGLSGALVLYVAPPEMWKATVQLLAESESCDSEAPAPALRRRCAWAERRLSGSGAGSAGAFRRVRVLAPGDFGPTLRAVRARLGEALPGGSSSKSSDRLASGAGLCSGGAALDLPPWCHLRQNVLWIDDQCLCQLVALESSRPEPARCFALEVEVTKGRRPPASFVWHTLEVYLPSLLYGLVMRAWIDGPLAPALRWVRYYGRPLPLSRRQRLECQLWEEALQCCSAWRLRWARLRGSCGPSFAALWATGEVQRHPLLGFRCSADSSAPSPRALRLGRGLVTADAPNKLRKADLNEFLLEALGELIQDALQHLGWVLLWPSVVQAVRHTPPLRSGGFFGELCSEAPGPPRTAETWRRRGGLHEDRRAPKFSSGGFSAGFLGRGAGRASLNAMEPCDARLASCAGFDEAVLLQEAAASLRRFAPLQERLAFTSCMVLAIGVLIFCIFWTMQFAHQERLRRYQLHPGTASASTKTEKSDAKASGAMGTGDAR